MNARVAKVAPLLFGSGTCALIYQVAWLREMRFIFGASTAASAAVLAIFMGGLGLGGALLGRRADVYPRPLAFYGRLELAIALSAALTPGLVWLARAAYIASGGTVVLGLLGATAARLLLAALVLCVPTFLMGGTLPAAAKAVETDEDPSRRYLAVLYGVNTLGAVTGTFVSTFILLEMLGTRMTLWSACGLNVLVALSAVLLARTGGLQPNPSARTHLNPVSMPGTANPHGSAGAPVSRRGQKPGREKQRDTAPLPTPRLSADAVSPGAAAPPKAFVLAAAGFVGFAFLLMELVWYRMLAPLLGGSSFTFGLILAVALFGIGTGGVAYSLLFSSRRATMSGFALSCALEAACIALPYALGDRVAFFALLLRPLSWGGFYGLVLGWAMVAGLVVWPAAFISGIQFPLLIALLGRAGDKVGSDTGLAYAWNTVGAILGSLAGGFGLLPLLSAPGAWRAAAALLVILGIAATVLSFLREHALQRLLMPVAAAVAALVMLSTTGPTSVWRHGGIGAGRADSLAMTRNGLHKWANVRRHAVQWEADGVESSVALEALDSYDFLVNGKVDGNSRADAPTQVMAGIIGTIIHPHPTTALVIGLGTGSTAGWLGSIPSMERVDVVELEPSILHVAKICSPVNRNVLDNPKVHIFIGDAREVLLTTPKRYDIIFSEPSNPYRAGVSSLFTKDFYQAVASKLADGGIFSQWLQAYEVDGQTLRTAYATMAAVFPSVETWRTRPTDLLLVAAKKPLTYDVPALRARVEEEPFKTALATIWRVVGLEGFLSHYVANASLTQAIARLEGTNLSTDDRTLLEFAFARSVGQSNLFDVSQLWGLAQKRNEERPMLSGGDVNWSNVADQRVSISAAEGEAAPMEAGFSDEQRGRAIAQNLYTQADFESTLSTWREQPQEPIAPLEIAAVAESLAAAGNDEALKYIEQLRQFQPGEADAILGHLRWRQNRFDEAATALDASFVRHQSDPWPLGPIMQRAMAAAGDIAVHDTTIGERLFHTLGTPFAVLAENESRLAARIKMGAVLDFKKFCVEVLQPYDEYPLWEAYYLSGRLACYQVLKYPRLPEAQRDFDAFVADEPSAFDVGLRPAGTLKPEESGKEALGNGE